MLDKIRAIGDYIKKNNVGGELKDKFVNVLEGYKSKIANGGRSGIGATGPQATSSSPLHKTVMSAIMKYKGRPASGKEEKYNPYIRPAGEKPVSDGDGIQAELNRAYKKDPSQYHDDSQQIRDMENRINQQKKDIRMMGQRNKEDNRPDYSRQALINF